MNEIINAIRTILVPRVNYNRELNAFSSSKYVLDVGCGRGHFLNFLGDRGVGIDGSQDNVNLCREMGLKVYHLIFPNRIPFPDEIFDGVYLSHFIEHFSPDGVILIMREINRVLKRGGIIFIRSPLYSSAFWDDPTHVRPYPLHSLLHLLGGWEINGRRQMIVGEEKPTYRVVSYYEELIPLYISSIAPTIAPSQFPIRLFLRAVTHFMTKLHIGRKGAYGAVLLKNGFSGNFVG